MPAWRWPRRETPGRQADTEGSCRDVRRGDQRAPADPLAAQLARRAGGAVARAGGQGGGFLALRQVATSYQALDAAELDRLVGRARSHAEAMERLRLAVAADVLV
jgi:hypothetical protein